MKKRSITILGSTGSIGVNALEVISNLKATVGLSSVLLLLGIPKL